MMIMLLFSFLFVFIMFLLVMILETKKKNYFSSNTSIECGFEIKMFSRPFMSIRFFMISLLFIIFDLESIFLFSSGNIFLIQNSMHYNIMMILFLLLLLLSIFLEWKNKFLEWY
uniref:NADH-ubiquinone oxidoreductase chain 3 n=1 Tax=Bathynella cf. rufa JHS-2017 TaxID=2029186 RepID=A0A7R6D922_9CRUS|nr:NADH dehydrogenase subunit 3 [Bathynella cf. rufa JHS-2017]